MSFFSLVIAGVIGSSLNFSRVHFAFLDGCHTYEDVIFEFNIIKNSQFTGDVVVFDDYTNNLYDGVVKAVDEICKNIFTYKILFRLMKKEAS